MTTADWRTRFAGLNPRPIDLGLGRMRQALERLGHPEAGLQNILHISGTNGKGSTVATLEAAFVQAGIRVQSYSSPFLWQFEENIRLDRQAIPADQCATHFAHLWEVCSDIQLTWFEADTLVALLAFADWEAEVTVLECGMGGASDATAVVPPPLAAILTNVGGDHAEFLGSDLAKVAVEKAGIAKGAPLYVPDDFIFEVGPVHRVPTRGQHPSLSLAQAVLRDHFPDVALPTKVPEILGRWYRDPQNPACLYDVGHNAHAAQFLAQRLAQEPGPYRLDLGMLLRKDPRAFLDPFVELNPWVHPIDLGEEGHGVEALTQIAQDLGLHVWSHEPYQTRLVTGSHQTVAQELKQEV